MHVFFYLRLIALLAKNNSVTNKLTDKAIPRPSSTVHTRTC